MKNFKTIAISAISFFAILMQADALQAQTPAANGSGHRKAAVSASRLKSGKATAPASTANASTPAATGSGPSSSDIHTSAGASPVKQSQATKTAASSSSHPASSPANTPGIAGGTSGKQPGAAVKIVPPPAATGSGPSSSDIHTTAKPAAVPPVKAKPDKKKRKTGKS